MSSAWLSPFPKPLPPIGPLPNQQAPWTSRQCPGDNGWLGQESGECLSVLASRPEFWGWEEGPVERQEGPAWGLPGSSTWPKQVKGVIGPVFFLEGSGKVPSTPLTLVNIVTGCSIIELCGNGAVTLKVSPTISLLISWLVMHPALWVLVPFSLCTLGSDSPTLGFSFQGDETRVLATLPSWVSVLMCFPLIILHCDLNYT